LPSGTELPNKALHPAIGRGRPLAGERQTVRRTKHTMRIRAYLFLLVGLVSLVLATREFLDATYFVWRTSGPVPTGHRARSRRPTSEETKEFADKAQEELTYAAHWALASILPFVAFGFECRRAWLRRRAIKPLQRTIPPQGNRSSINEPLVRRARR
jgi:hypothetical protein